MTSEVRHSLKLRCGICSTRDEFAGNTQRDAIYNARRAGWIVTITPNRARCPEHAGKRRRSTKVAGYRTRRKA